ncbi:hypothetical protein VNO77_16973 [Canavalia gladiata]|uniref:Uncharacterized protein n=1 Tax=Canavalia gladiata TaxID=3824 RepID=A0AAN9LI58_CANGL
MRNPKEEVALLNEALEKFNIICIPICYECSAHANSIHQYCHFRTRLDAKHFSSLSKFQYSSFLALQ